MPEWGIGEKLRDLREYYQVSQRELALGICSQKTISKVERSEMQPTAEILQKLGLRLGVDISYFFEEQEAPRFNYIKETRDRIGRLISKWEYKEAMGIIREELKNPLFRKKNHRKYLLWKRSVCHFNLTNEKEEAIELLQLALDMSTHSKKTITNDDIGIYLSMGNMYSDIGDFENALTYFNTAKEMCKRIPDYRASPPVNKLYYNLSLLYFRMKLYNKAIEIAQEGIKFIYEKDSIYLLGELYYQKGLAMYYSGNRRKALKAMETSLFLFDIRDQKAFYSFVETHYLRFQRLSLRHLN